MNYAKILFVKLMDWICVRCDQITPGDLMKNQDKMQATYNIKFPIEILFDQMEMGQEFAITGNYPFYDQHLADMGITQIFATQEYTHEHHMWNSIAENDITRVCFKENLQSSYLDREKLE